MSIRKEEYITLTDCCYCGKKGEVMFIKAYIGFSRSRLNTRVLCKSCSRQHTIFLDDYKANMEVK